MAVKRFKPVTPGTRFRVDTIYFGYHNKRS